MSRLLDTLPYNILVRIWHPSIEPETITRVLDMQPHISWRAGAARVTPNGTLLEGTRKESYWVYREVYAGDKLFFKNTAALIERLIPHREFLHRIVAEGGGTEIYIQLPGEVNRGNSLAPEALARMGDLHMRLSVEVFPHTRPLNQENDSAKP